jgi:hypothetical protein
MANIYNSIEPFIWYAVAIGLLPALRKYASLRRRILLSAAICIFGTSDFYEETAWWTPWWLFAWKAVSLLMIVLLAYSIAQSRRDAPSSSAQTDD